MGFDPDGEVFTSNDRMYRGIFPGKGEKARRVYELCRDANLFNQGVVNTVIVDNGLFSQLGYDLVLEHERVSFISYAHEWTPEMLKDAALFQLDLNLKLLDAGLILKDCGVSTNVLFEETKPIYVDFLSIIPIDELAEQEWLKPTETAQQHYIGMSKKSQYLYEVFKRMFYPGILFPLYLLHQNKTSLSRKRLLETALNTTTDTISEQEVFSGADRISSFNYQKYKHLKEDALRNDNWKQFFLIQKHEIENLHVVHSQSGYSDYYELKGEDYEFSPSSFWKPKQWGVYNAINNLKPMTVLDIGANTGWFSILATKLGAKVVSLDNDVACIDTLYRRAKQESLSILPLIVDFLDPTPDVEAMSALKKDPRVLSSRFKCDLPLLLSSDKRIACDMVIALALIHHLCLGGGRHLSQVTKQLSSYANKYLILEFVTKNDPLIINEPTFFRAQHANPGAFDWYSLDTCINLLSKYFGTIEKIPLTETRVLLICTDKTEDALHAHITGNNNNQAEIHSQESEPEQHCMITNRINPKILFTTPVIEHPPASGPSLRIENTVKALNQVSELHLAVRIGQDAIGGPYGEEFYRHHSHVFAYTPNLTGSGNLDDESQNALAIVKYADAQGIKIIWCGYGNISHQLMKTIKELNPALKIVCDTDSVWSRFVLRELPLEQDPVRRQKIGHDGWIKEREEAEWTNFCDVTTAVSTVDMEYYQKLAADPSRIHQFSNVIDLDTYTEKPVRAADLRTPSMVLSGTFYSDTSPMVRAARWVINEVLPMVEREIPNITLYCIGNGADKALADIQKHNIVIKGKVASVLPYLCHADTALVPLMFESGTRFKILEAAACNVPIVSTTLGAEGIPVTSGTHILIADDPISFSKAIISVINDQQFANKLRRNSSELIKANYNICTLINEAVSIINYLETKTD